MDDKIRSLCAQILDGNDDEKLVVELREALHQHIQQIRATFAGYPRGVERRSAREGSPESAVERTNPKKRLITHAILKEDIGE